MYTRLLAYLENQRFDTAGSYGASLQIVVLSMTVVTVLWLAAVVSFTILTSSSSYYIIAIYGVCALFPALGFIAAHRRSAPLLILYVLLTVLFIFGNFVASSLFLRDVLTALPCHECHFAAPHRLLVAVAVVVFILCFLFGLLQIASLYMAFMMRTTLPPDVHSYRSILAPQSMPEYFTSTLELIGGVEKELAVEGLPEKVKIICAILLILGMIASTLDMIRIAIGDRIILTIFIFTLALAAPVTMWIGAAYRSRTILRYGIIFGMFACIAYASGVTFTCIAISQIVHCTLHRCVLIGPYAELHLILCCVTLLAAVSFVFVHIPAMHYSSSLYGRLPEHHGSIQSPTETDHLSSAPLIE